jgi:tetratricopeptide (TPR) repeat protein
MVSPADSMKAVAQWVEQQSILAGADEPSRQVDIHRSAGERLMKLGEYGNAADQYFLAVDACDTAGDATGAINCLLDAARCYSLRNDAQTSLHLATAACEQAHALGYNPGIAQSLLEIGNSKWQMARMPEAREYLVQARGLFKELGDHYHVAIADLSLGTVAALSRDYDVAEATFLSALAYFKQEQHFEPAYRVVNNLAGVMFQRRDFVKARQYLEECRTYDPQRQGARQLNASYNLGLLDVLEGKLDDARKNLNRALLLARKSGDVTVESNVLINLALAALLAGDPAEALNYGNLAGLRAQGLPSEAQQPVVVMRTIMLLANGRLAGREELPVPLPETGTEVLWQLIPALEYITRHQLYKSAVQPGLAQAQAERWLAAAQAELAGREDGAPQ